MVRHDGHVGCEATVLRIVRDEGLIVPARYQRERRKPAEPRKAAFVNDPTGGEPGVAAGLLRVRDHHRRNVAHGRMSGLLVRVRASVPGVPDREPA